MSAPTFNGIFNANAAPGSATIGTTATPITSNTTTYANPVFGIKLTDSSPHSTDPLAQGDDGMLPAIRVEVTATGTGQPNPIYGFLFGNSTTASTSINSSNLVGAMLGAQIGSTDTHSGVWGANALALSLRTNQNQDFQMFGFEANVFNDWKDSGSALPQATWMKCGVSSTSSGDYPIHVGFLATYSSGSTAQSATNGNRQHIGLLVSDAIDFGLVLGDASSSSPTSGAPLKMAVGAKFSETGIATGTGQNNTNYGSVNVGFYLNVCTGASTGVEHAFFLSAQPGATTGANPTESLQIQYNTAGPLIFGLRNDSTLELGSGLGGTLDYGVTVASRFTFNGGLVHSLSGFNVPSSSGTALAVGGNTIITSDATNFVAKCAGAGGAFAFQTNTGVGLATIQADGGTNRSLNLSGGIQLSTSAATLESGTGAPTATRPVGSLFLRTDGAAGSRLYVSAGSGTWTAVAGV